MCGVFYFLFKRFHVNPTKTCMSYISGDLCISFQKGRALARNPSFGPMVSSRVCDVCDASPWLLAEKVVPQIWACTGFLCVLVCYVYATTAEFNKFAWTSRPREKKNRCLAHKRCCCRWTTQFSKITLMVDFLKKKKICHWNATTWHGNSGMNGIISM